MSGRLIGLAAITGWYITHAVHLVFLLLAQGSWLSGTQTCFVMQGRTPSDNLYIRGLPASWTDEDLANLCSPYGVVKVSLCTVLHVAFVSAPLVCCVVAVC